MRLKWPSETTASLALNTQKYFTQGVRYADRRRYEEADH